MLGGVPRQRLLDDATHAAAPVEVVALHGGFTTAAEDWEPLSPLLDPRLVLTCPPLRGHPGASLPPGEPIGPESIAADLIALVRDRGAAASVLAGFSLGARAAMLAAADGSSPSALVLIGPRFEPISAPDFERVINRVFDQAPVWAAPEHAAAVDAMRAGIVGYRMDAAAWAERVASVPILAMRGTHDRVCTEADYRQLAELCPHARVETIQDAGHRVQDTEPELVAGFINIFLAESGVL